jgi:hypothetical protein
MIRVVSSGNNRVGGSWQLPERHPNKSCSGISLILATHTTHKHATGGGTTTEPWRCAGATPVRAYCPPIAHWTELLACPLAGIPPRQLRATNAQLYVPAGVRDAVAADLLREAADRSAHDERGTMVRRQVKLGLRLTLKGQAMAEQFGDLRDAIIDRARRSGMKVQVTTHCGIALQIYLPNGAVDHVVLVTPSKAELLVKSSFEHWTVLGDYLAIYDKSHNMIEAEIIHLSGLSPVVYDLSLMDLPGVSWGPPWQPNLFDEDYSQDEVVETIKTALANPHFREATLINRPWTLPLRSVDGGLTAEISSCSAELLSIDTPDRSEQWQTLGIKLLNQECRNHDEALDRLQCISSALFFEMDLCYNMQLTLARRRALQAQSHTLKTSDEDTRRPPQMPRVRYRHDAVSLYLHGRSSHSLPLSQFLAYYQAIEYHFPFFVEQDLLKRMKAKLRDPRFDSEKESHLQELLHLTGSGARRALKEEREQLKTTLAACVDETRLVDFLKGDDARWRAISSRSTIKYVPVVNDRNSESSLIAQLAERIYQIRCRIVHAKEDGGPKAKPMLLPTSTEVRYLWHDVGIVQYLAQQVIIAGADP